MSTSKKLFFSLLSFLIICNLSSCDNRGYKQNEGIIWHTGFHITYRSDRDYIDSIMTVLNRVGDSMNVFDPGSLTSRVNREDSVEINQDFAQVYNMSERINRLTGGAFDPTLGPLITAWGFGKGHRATSDTLRIDSLLQLVGINKTKISGGRLIKQNRAIEFNFSAIAKGYGCDVVAAMLKRNGVQDYLVEIGGEIACSGVGPSGGKWRVSIDRPDFSDSICHDSQCIIELSDCGLATSGNYRNYHGEGAGRYGHTISPTTGHPVSTDVLSATVIAPTCMEADALATSMMALGSAKARRLAGELHLPVLLVLNDMTTWQSEEFRTIRAATPEP